MSIILPARSRNCSPSIQNLFPIFKSVSFAQVENSSLGLWSGVCFVTIENNDGETSLKTFPALLPHRTSRRRKCSFVLPVSYRIRNLGFLVLINIQLAPSHQLTHEKFLLLSQELLTLLPIW